AWARWVRPWTLAAWMFLTAGIALGSWWAYYELGWGGWWFWDPVENASFMPWLAGTALLHSAIVAEKRDTLKVWTILLAIVAFSLSLIGTFLVRSGVLSSVHAFAVDPARGVFILMILLFFIGGSLALYATRAAGIRRGGSFAPVSREGALVLNNLLLSVAMAAVFIGTLFPLAYEAVTGGGKITVGPPYFNFTFGILMIPLLLVLPVGALLPWKRGGLHDVLRRLWWAAVLAVAAVVIAAFVTDPKAVRAALGIGLGAWIIAGTLVALAERAMFGRVPFATALRRLASQPGQTWGMVLAHVGLGVMVVGIIIVSAFKAERITAMTPGKTVTIAGLQVKMLGEKRVTGPNYLAEQAAFAVSAQDRPLGTVFSEKRVFIARRDMPTTEVGLMHFFSGDLYVAIGDKAKDGRVVRLYFNPMIWLLWLGAALMFSGGLATLADRRFRLRLRQRIKAAQPA
ncbi:MAG TPA: heme lyase CcmF/NrfE family subunit, partial [Thermopetrobacter sp.]|nr:heme lyase CcmF/NrfE family subunit [Thermopetrobacter sp.]